MAEKNAERTDGYHNFRPFIGKGEDTENCRDNCFKYIAEQNGCGRCPSEGKQGVHRSCVAGPYGTDVLSGAMSDNYI